MTALFERLAARAAAVAPLAVPGLQLVPRGAIALAEHVNRYYRVLHGTDPENVAVRLPTGGGSFEVRHSATNAALLRVTDAGLDFPAGGIGTIELADGSVTSAKILDNEIVNADINAAAGIVLSKLQAVASNQVLVGTGAGVGSRTLVDADIAAAGTANIAVAKLAHVGAGNVLRSNGAQNAAGQVANADLAGGIGLTKLLHVGAGNILRSDGAQNVAGQVVNADIAPAGTANIAVNKLAHLGAGNILRSDGVQTVASPMVTGDIPAGTILNANINAAANINGSKLLDNSVTSAKLAGGIAVGAGTITTTEILDGTILNVDVNAAAAIAVAKLAHVGANNVLRSNGTTNVGGQVQTADIAAGAVTNSVLVTVPASNTTSTGANNMTGATITMTTQGGPVLFLLHLQGMYNSALTNACTIQLWEAAALATLMYGDLLTSFLQDRMGFFLYTPSAGTHTFVAAWFTQTASGEARHAGGSFSATEFKR